MPTNPDQRPSGLEPLGDIPWGTHFCQFYESKEDLLEILVPYFAAGLRGNEYCMWVTSEPLGVAEATAGLRTAVPDLDRYLAAGAIEIIGYEDWYLAGGSFDADRVLEGWVTKLDKALAAGFDGLRLTGNTFWLEKTLWADFAAYEGTVNDVIGQYRMIAACTYALPTCSASEIVDVVQTHMFALIKRDLEWVLIENSERKRTAEAIERLNEHLQQRTRDVEKANRGLEAFSYSVSHDLRAPLRAIRGFSQMLLSDYATRLDDDGQRIVRTIDERAAAMSQLIDDILDFSRATWVTLEPVPISMDSIVRGVYEELKPATGDRSVEFVLHPLRDTNGDPRAIRQLVANLLDNALKFTQTVGSPRIEVACEEGTHETVYLVKDNGVGFDMQYADKLFGLFQRLHPRADFTGTGVGLAIVEQIVARHGGRAWADGKVGEGATFYFSLPAGEVPTERGLPA